MLAAYRVGDSPFNVITPLMAYFPLIVIFTKRYQRDAGIGTVVSLMLPYVVFLTVAWTLFFIAWYLLGVPLDRGRPFTTAEAALFWRPSEYVTTSHEQLPQSHVLDPGRGEGRETVGASTCSAIVSGLMDTRA